MAIRVLSALAAPLLALAACGPGFDRPVGVDDPTYGLAVQSNALVARGGAPLISLRQRFATEAPVAVTFAFDSAALDPTARATLDRQADWMRQFPEVGFRVYGHADAPGSNAYNESLGRRRAQAVVGYLAARGVSPSRLEALVSFGERRPVIPGDGRERLNRRAVTDVSGFVSRHPTVLDGEYAAVVQREYVASAARGPGIETGGAGTGAAAAE